jgi:hypothetical protein
MSDPKQADAWHKAGIANAARRSRTRLACAKGPPVRVAAAQLAVDRDNPN